MECASEEACEERVMYCPECGSKTVDQQEGDAGYLTNPITTHHYCEGCDITWDKRGDHYSVCGRGPQQNAKKTD